MIHIISEEDYIPSDEIIIDLIKLAKEYLNTGHTYFEINIEKGILKCKEYIKEYDIWGKLLDADPWVPNVGTTMRGVNKVPAPTLRGEFIPNPITQEPLRDVIEVRETKEDVQLYRHNFESAIFHFLPSFQDFLTDHIDKHSEEIDNKIIVAKDLFYRTAIFHGSPFVWICSPTDGNLEMRQVPYWGSPTISAAKTNAVIQQLVADIGGTLDLRNIKKLGTVMYSDLRAVPYSGSIS